jgi:hypothetical protein
LHEPAEDEVVLPLIEILHLLIDPLADQLADSDPLTGDRKQGDCATLGNLS